VAGGVELVYSVVWRRLVLSACRGHVAGGRRLPASADGAYAEYTSCLDFEGDGPTISRVSVPGEDRSW
jgi:hypothetical protein